MRAVSLCFDKKQIIRVVRMLFRYLRRIKLFIGGPQTVDGLTSLLLLQGYDGVFLRQDRVVLKNTGLLDSCKSYKLNLEDFWHRHLLDLLLVGLALLLLLWKGGSDRCLAFCR